MKIEELTQTNLHSSSPKKLVSAAILLSVMGLGWPIFQNTKLVLTCLSCKRIRNARTPKVRNIKLTPQCCAGDYHFYYRPYGKWDRSGQGYTYSCVFFLLKASNILVKYVVMAGLRLI
jgi:hypothetical protein